MCPFSSHEGARSFFPFRWTRNAIVYGEGPRVARMERSGGPYFGKPQRRPALCGHATAFLREGNRRSHACRGCHKRLEPPRHSVPHSGRQLPGAQQRISQIGDTPSEAQQGRAGCGLSEESPKRSDEHTSELQSLMRISYAVFCLKKKT